MLAASFSTLKLVNQCVIYIKRGSNGTTAMIHFVGEPFSRSALFALDPNNYSKLMETQNTGVFCTGVMPMCSSQRLCHQVQHLKQRSEK
jgi:hypothetical protein